MSREQRLINGGDGGPDYDAECAATEVKYPDVKVRLTGTDGNAFAIIGNVSRALKRGGVRPDDVKAWNTEALSSPSYDALLQAAMRWVDVS